MRFVKFWAVAALMPLYACNADDSHLAQEPEPVDSAPQVQAPQAETAPTTEAQAEDVVEAGEEVATEAAGSQSEIVLAQADTSAAKTSRFTAGKDFEVFVLTFGREKPPLRMTLSDLAAARSAINVS